MVNLEDKYVHVCFPPSKSIVPRIDNLFTKDIPMKYGAINIHYVYVN